MELRNYQKEAVENIMNGIKEYRKIRIEIPIGLGRFPIIAEVALKCITNGIRVLVLLPDKNKCFRLKNLCTEKEENLECALTFEAHKGQKLLFAVYDDFEEQAQVPEFDVVICDGIHRGNRNGKLTQLSQNAHTHFVGFTSQLRGKVTGFFRDSEHNFQYTLDKAIKSDDLIEEYEFVTIVFKIFQALNYEVEATADQNDTQYDLIAKKQNEQLKMVVKNWSSKQFGTNELINIVKGLNTASLAAGEQIILVTNTVVSEKQRKETGKVSKAAIIDVQNLLYMVQGKATLESELRGYLSYTTDDITPLEPELKFEVTGKSDKTSEIKRLIDEMESWYAPDTKFTEYEKTCSRALKLLFEDELTLWREQKSSARGLYRFDLVCKIKESSADNVYRKEFWTTAEKFFQTKYIIFEFKNYKSKITQKEIYSTEKYLYLKALRGVAIIISVMGTDDNANRAIQGALRDDGKVIISLTNNDLIDMLKMKMENKDATSYLGEKLDELLFDLEK